MLPCPIYFMCLAVDHGVCARSQDA
jgi:hypothetical protein